MPLLTPRRLKLAVTGAAGLFGAGMARIFSASHEVLALTRQNADIRVPEQLRRALVGFAPDIIVHSAAIPSPDVCEQNPQLAFELNVGGTESVVKVASELGSAVGLISTDAVFDGTKGSPYTETDSPNPIGIYGRSKLMAESVVQQLERHFIFRVSVLFGRDKENFVSKSLSAIRNGQDTIVARDQVGSATYVDDAAEKILEVLEAGACGTFHLSNEGTCSRYDIARESAIITALDVTRVVGVPLAQMDRPGPRVKYSVMAMEALLSRGFRTPRNWRAALSDYITWLEKSE